MNNPISTYRFQFNKDFTFNDAEKLIPYLQKSAIKTIYASPVFKATAGSTHGYDITDPLQINPEIGTEQDFSRLIKKAKDAGIGWLQDIVPNHMAFSPENPWIYDVLEKGRNSAFYEFFDFHDNHPDENLHDKMMLPFFGKSLDQMLDDNELSIAFDSKGFKLVYFENNYPVSVPAYPKLLEAENKTNLPKTVAAFLGGEKKVDEFNENRHRLFTDYSQSELTKNYVDARLKEVNNNPVKLKAVIDELYYYPSFWKDTEQKINFRRFFTINGLICVNIQNQKVFEVTHKLIEKWIYTGTIEGLRVDHIDGLYNPGMYLEQLRNLAGDKTYLLVEKILEKDEPLPGDWPIEGTTGYDFLGMVNNLLTNPEKEPLFYSYYNNWIEKNDDFDDVFYNKNRFILHNRLSGELDNLARECSAINFVKQQQLGEDEMRAAIGEFLVFCPIYKIYKSPSNFTDHEKKIVGEIIEKAMQKDKNKSNALKILDHLFLHRNAFDKNEVKQIDVFFRHCMQFTGPLMAKGIEDTAFYSYNPFICHNEVGDSPGYFGISTKEFHRLMKERQEKMPLTMNAISTHDTKRGEDARARLNVLSDIPEAWIKATTLWRELNHKFKAFDGGNEIPSANDEYFIYQVLVAHFPMIAQPDDSFADRLEDYLIKALREAKVNTSWSDPDEFYENKTVEFARNILSKQSTFPESFIAFLEDIIPHGIVNSITQLILKNMVPGVPDTFQGTENWNLSFVDPDNRREVDYESLAKNLEAFSQNYKKDAQALAGELWQNPLDGKIKHFINWLTLQERVQHENLFLKGSYEPLRVTGKYKKHVIAFHRSFEEEHLIVALPLNTANLPVDVDWEDTTIELPEMKGTKLENRLTKEKFQVGNSLNVQEIFAIIPFGVLKNS
ncbi:MAG TPA: malto-oligosyltrehalose synthase [Prolixibacteraceae bacterium]|nr:malto-oligosyltrehalose synthase [Prolixibacteraceae bacterium]